jgi:glycolate dehydrogenase iron-sulfur subunit
MKEVLETGRGEDELQTHLDRCLTCGSCETTCPSGVNYLKLVDIGRSYLSKRNVRPKSQQVLRRALIAMLTNQGLFEALMTLGRLTRFAHPFLPKKLQAMTGLLPIGTRQSIVPSAIEVEGERKMRVALHLGCVQKSLRPQVNEATRRVLSKLGCEVILPDGFGCCGALADHLSEKEKAKAKARANIKALERAADKEAFDAIVSNASGCGVALQGYGHLFRGDPLDLEAAERVASLTLDVSQVLERLDLGPARKKNGRRVAYQSSCTLQHGMGIKDLPQTLLEHFGYEVVEPSDPHLCCGSAGAYSIFEPDLSRELRHQKTADLNKLGADCVASANIGCITGLASSMDIPVRHFIELIDDVTN